MKKILGLDLGTNSIGWSLIDQDFENKKGSILGLGSRIIPMSQDILGKFDSGVSISQTAERTGYRGARRLYQRDNLRRERLHRVLHVLGFLPEHYADSIDFEKRLGQFKNGIEVKLNYKPNGTKPNGNPAYDFCFPDSFNEMVSDFSAKNLDTKIPYDWTLYYLRKKALTQKITKEELAWVLLNFNQKRGYYQLRGEEESDEDKQKEFCQLQVAEVTDSGSKVKDNILYDVVFSNGWKYEKQITKPEDWIDKKKEFIVTTSTTKNGDIKRSFKIVDSEKDWIAIKKKTEQDIGLSGKTVGQYIYESLLAKPTQKIRGKLVKTIERKFYKDELKQILETQCQLHSELQDPERYSACLEELYPKNQAHKATIKDKGFDYLFLEDIIFYQRPLKSKKSSISGCQYETRRFQKTNIDPATKQEKTSWVKEAIKAIPKSHPLYQEFRLWQFLQNLKVYQKEATVDGRIKHDLDVTQQVLKTEDEWVKLFDFLSDQKEIEQKQFIAYLMKEQYIPKTDKDNYRWNYVEDKKYPMCETHAQFVSRFKKVDNLPEQFLTADRELLLWHIIYSVKDIHEYKSALEKFANKQEIDKDSFVSSFLKFPPFSSDYGAYSYKALNKLLPLMRRGKYWDESAITKETTDRQAEIFERLQTIDFNQASINDTIADDDIPKQILKSFCAFKDKNPLAALSTHQACYLVYNRYSESADSKKWTTPSDIQQYLTQFKQHSLRNPIVEQVVTETLRTVQDIWEHYGKGAPDYFNEIHIELGREMKNPAKKREDLSRINTENENTNHRIKELLKEMMNDPKAEGDIRPYSPSQQELLKIYEDGVAQNPKVAFEKVKEDDINKIRKNASPSKSDIVKYKLWLEQGYISPYTGQVIPLSKLFTTDYQIEHVIPQSRYFNNSLNNKIICESEVNALKSNKTAYEFLKDERGSIVDLGQGKQVKLFSLEAYEKHCNGYFKKNKAKLKNLLSEDIPEGFIERQLNDSRYISKLVKGLLSNIVKDEGEQEATSKHIVPVTGAVTSKLKQDWGLNDKWNELVAPRFERMNSITGTQDFGYWDKSINAFRTAVPDDIAKGFNKKRIDHRHHALDALVIACTTKDHINYITSLNTERKNHALVSKLRAIEEKQITNKKTGQTTMKKVAGAYHHPWASFTTDARDTLATTIISFKQNLRVINKTNNKTWQWNTAGDKKELIKQTKGKNWAIRKPMHKETVSGKVSIRQTKTVTFANGLKDWNNLVDKQLKHIIKGLINSGGDLQSVAKYFKTNPYKSEGKAITKLMVYYFTSNATASRTALSDKFTRKHLESVTDSGIQSILNKHVEKYTTAEGKEQFDLAFSEDGIEQLNKNLTALNNGKPHQPIYKVRIYEEGSKFQVGHDGAKADKYVEAAKGTNLFFTIYWNEEKQKREYETIPLNMVIEHQKQVAHLPKEERTFVPVNPEKGQFLFSLSPNDLVYVPTEEEVENNKMVNFAKLSKVQVDRIYKMVSSTGNECQFIHNQVATLIKIYDVKSKLGEYGSLNKMETAITGERIKERCWKLQVNRLGKIISVTNHLGQIVQIGE